MASVVERPPPRNNNRGSSEAANELVVESRGDMIVAVMDLDDLRIGVVNDDDDVVVALLLSTSGVELTPSGRPPTNEEDISLWMCLLVLLFWLS
jgi:hypothetical protein